MKPTELQKKIIDICITELRCWRNTNDITSPTHYSDAEAELYKLDYDDELPSIYCDEINARLQELRYAIIKFTKDENNRTD